MMEQFAFWASVVALAASIWSAWFGWYCGQIADPTSRASARALKRKSRRR